MLPTAKSLVFSFLRKISHCREVLSSSLDHHCPTVNPAAQLLAHWSRPVLISEVLTCSSNSRLLSCLCWAAFLHRRCLNRWNSSCAFSLCVPTVSERKTEGGRQTISLSHLWVSVFTLGSTPVCRTGQLPLGHNLTVVLTLTQLVIGQQPHCN